MNPLNVVTLVVVLLLLGWVVAAIVQAWRDPGDDG